MPRYTCVHAGKYHAVNISQPEALNLWVDKAIHNPVDANNYRDYGRFSDLSHSLRPSRLLEPMTHIRGNFYRDLQQRVLSRICTGFPFNLPASPCGESSGHQIGCKSNKIWLNAKKTLRGVV